MRSRKPFSSIDSNRFKVWLYPHKRKSLLQSLESIIGRFNVVPSRFNPILFSIQKKLSWKKFSKQLKGDSTQSSVSLSIQPPFNITCLYLQCCLFWVLACTCLRCIEWPPYSHRLEVVSSGTTKEKNYIFAPITKNDLAVHRFVQYRNFSRFYMVIYQI